MHILDGTAKLNHEASNFRQTDSLSRSDHFLDRSVGAQLKYDIGVLLKCESFVELNDVRMKHFGMDLQLGPKL